MHYHFVTTNFSCYLGPDLLPITHNDSAVKINYSGLFSSITKIFNCHFVQLDI